MSLEQKVFLIPWKKSQLDTFHGIYHERIQDIIAVKKRGSISDRTHKTVRQDFKIIPVDVDVLVEIIHERGNTIVVEESFEVYFLRTADDFLFSGRVFPVIKIRFCLAEIDW